MVFSGLVGGFVALTLALLPSVQGYANPGACSGDCYAHDPSLIKRSSDGKYFRFNTGGKIMIYSSSSLTGPWVYQGAAIPAGSKINLTGKDDLWAPDVQLIGDTYYMYYTVSSFGSQNSAIGYATSKTLEAGSWVDHGATGVASSSGKNYNYNCIDANLIKSGSDWYMNFGSFWGDIYQVKMTAGVNRPSGTPYNLAYNASGTHAEEGSFMHYRAPYYYLYFSAGSCCGYATNKPAKGAEYSIRVCRSKTVSGPFVDASGKACTAGGGTVVLASHDRVYGPGGQGVLSDGAHGTVLYYHYADTSVGLADAKYRFGWNVINWSTGWPVV